MFSKYCSCTLLLLLANHIQLLADVQPHGLQHARLFCPPLSSGVCSHSRPLNGGCYLTILSSEPFSFCHKYFLALGSFPMTQLFASGGQSIGASASACPSTEFSGLTAFMIDWFGLLAVQGTLKSLLQNDNLKESVLQCSVFFMVQLTSVHGYWKIIIALTIGNFVSNMFLSFWVCF